MSEPVKIVQPPDKPVGPELIATALLDIAKAMKVLNQTQLKRRAIVTLIHEESKIARRDIEIVLNNLDQLEATWLKPKPAK